MQGEERPGQPVQPGENPAVRSAVSGVYDWMGAVIFSLIAVTLAFAFLFRVVGVKGDSMNSTLSDGERLIVTRLFYRPERGDIVIVGRPDGQPLVKRVIAAGGDRLRIGEDGVFVNGKRLDEPYARGTTASGGFGTQEQAVPEGCAFVMGDNREHSKDSRNMAEIGFVRESDLVGRAVFRFFPLSRARVLS
ncbi:MAG TPA: signal peptidase I [Firmicutes bacterium]|nr:signal peptidase I [Bacillota bacterium]